MLQPILAWLAKGGTFDLGVVRTKRGAEVEIVDPFGVIYHVPFDVADANKFTEAMFNAAMGHLENDPLLVEDDYETF